MTPIPPVVLASASPRRRELLREVVQDFEVDTADLDEDSLTVADPWLTAKGLALAKARLVAQRHPGKLVVGGDTVVAYESASGEYRQLTKPRDREDAVAILTALSGREHFVATALALVRDDYEDVDVQSTTVWFREVTQEEITRYASTEEPMDKAGAYAIQGGAKGFVTQIEGSLSNVIGLPLELLQEMLSRRGA